MSPRFTLLLAAASTLLCVASVQAAAQARKRPNVLFLLTDDQRPDTIHALGNKLIRTPHLDRLVMQGTAFRRAICANPICTPSRAEIMSGCNSFRNGVLDFGRKIRGELSLWADTLRQVGYHTWYVGKWHNDGRPTERGYERSNGLFAGGGGRWAVPAFDWHGRAVTGYRGWVLQDDKRRLFPEQGIGLTPNISEHFADAAIELIRQKPQRPFFLHVNFPAPHDPLLMPFGYEGMYDPAAIPLPKNFREQHPFDHGNFKGRDEVLLPFPRTAADVKEDRAVYYSVISHLDAQIGRILASLDETKQLENTVVIFASDHGLAMGSHGLRGKQNMYEHTINVPLIISGPGVRRGRVSAAQCHLRDLFPTACALTGVPIPSSVQGKSLVPILRGESDALYEEVFGYFRNFQRMIRGKRWKYIEYPQVSRRQLFDLDNDPHELNNLADQTATAEIQKRLAMTLRNWQRENNDPVLSKK